MELFRQCYRLIGVGPLHPGSDPGEDWNLTVLSLMDGPRPGCTRVPTRVRIGTIERRITAAGCLVLHPGSDPGEDWNAIPPSILGAWATGETVEAARRELREVVEDMILISARTGSRMPEVGGISLEPREHNAAAS